MALNSGEGHWLARGGLSQGERLLFQKSTYVQSRRRNIADRGMKTSKKEALNDNESNHSV